jgi:hypothetical protein
MATNGTCTAMRTTHGKAIARDEEGILSVELDLLVLEQAAWDHDDLLCLPGCDAQDVFSLELRGYRVGG